MLLLTSLASSVSLLSTKCVKEERHLSAKLTNSPSGKIWMLYHKTCMCKHYYIRALYLQPSVCMCTIIYLVCLSVVLSYAWALLLEETNCFLIYFICSTHLHIWPSNLVNNEIYNNLWCSLENNTKVENTKSSTHIRLTKPIKLLLT